jgi:hypothetical protein
LSIVAVQVDLPGARPPRLALTGLRAAWIPGHQSILIGVANPGNVLVKGTGALTVVDRSGRRVERRAFALDTLVSHTQISYPVYTAGGTPPSSSRSWPIIPFALAVAVAAALLATTALSVGRLLRVKGAARSQA